jgi:conjugative transposon TraM protein
VKTAVVPITGVREQVVSALPQAISDAEFVATYSQERNIGFFSPEGGDRSQVKNTIRACIHDDQAVSEGTETQRNVRIRLTEPMSAGGTVIPAHTILTGLARIGERLDVIITSIEYMGRIYATDIAVYDVDGQRGISIPPSMEANALREVAANTGSSMGTSITFSQSAGQQIAADLGKGVIQGTSQYISKKMRVVKIHLKAGHQIFLLPKEI